MAKPLQMRLCRTDYAEWRKFASASCALNDAEAHFGLNLRDALRANSHFLSSDPSLAPVADDLDSLCDAISKSNSSTVFINGGIKHLMALQEGFETRRAVLRDLDTSLKNACNTIASLHKKLTSLPSSSEEAKRCRIALEAAIRDEETQRTKLEAERSALSIPKILRSDNSHTFV
jgi:hypothetical protein